MSNGELLGKNLFLFCDGPPGCVMLWIRDAGAGAVGVPCHVDHLQEVLHGITYHVAAPGVECALRKGALSIEVELERPGGNRVSWSIPETAFRSALDRFVGESENRPYLG